MGTNKQMQLNNDKVRNLSLHTDTDQIAHLRNQNTSLLEYLTNVTNNRDQLMNELTDYLNSWSRDEGEIYSRRSTLVHNL